MKMPMDMSAVSEAAKKAGSLGFPLTVSPAPPAAPKLAEAPAMSLEGMPTPPELFKKARELMAKYDQPDLWIHAARVMDKDPGQLARMNLGIE